MNLITRIGYIPYRVVRRFAVANVCCFFAAEFGDLQATDLPGGMVFTEISAPMLNSLCGDYSDYFGDEHRCFLEDDQARGFAVFDGESLVSFLWMAIENIPGTINHDGSPDTQLPLYLPDGMAYIFSVFVLPEYRGRRIYASMISELSKQLSSQGFTALMLTTEGSNHRALRSVRRMGFQLVGRSMLFGVGRYVLAKYPGQPMAGGIQTGRYAGDTKI